MIDSVLQDDVDGEDEYLGSERPTPLQRHRMQRLQDKLDGYAWRPAIRRRPSWKTIVVKFYKT